MKTPNQFGAVGDHPDRRIAQLDGWRGISILFVCVGHLVNLRYGSPTSAIIRNFSFTLAEWGVDLFFVISGFIITKLALKESKQEGHFSIRNFYIRRCFRIVPAYFIFLACIALASACHLIKEPSHEVFAGVTTAAVFACNFPSINCGWFAGHTWTLAFEEQFYIVFPLLFAYAHWQARSVFGILFVCLLAFPFVRYFLHLGGVWYVIEHFTPSFSYICVGSLTAAYEDRIEHLSGTFAARWISITAGSLVFGLLLIDSVSAFPLGSRSAYILLSLSNVILPLGFAWLIATSVHQSNFLTRVLTIQSLGFIGLISYSLYLWQELFTAPPAYQISDSPFLFWPLMFVVASLSYYFIERPAVRRGKRFIAYANG